MEYKIMISDFEKICRVCLEFSTFKNIMDSSKALNIIEACASIQICAEDVLPKNICNGCLEHIDLCWKLKQKCEASNDILKKIIEIEKNQCELQQTNKSDRPVREKVEETQNKIKVSEKSEDETEEDVSENFAEADNIVVFKNKSTKVIQRISCKKLKYTKNSKVYTCGKCSSNQVFHELRTLSIHMQRVHKAPPLECNICFKKLYHKLHFDLHVRSHIEKLHKCDKCDKSFSQPYLLRNHQTVHTDEKLYSCNLCEKSFKDTFYLKRHSKRCHGSAQREICGICGKSIVHAYMKRHLARHGSRKIYKCTDCGREYCYRKLLETHMRTVHQRPMQRTYKYLCTICGKRVLAPKDLRTHMRVHTGEKPFQCELCEKSYKTSSTLIEHVRASHTQERTHVCNICSKAFYRKGILKNHMQTHSTNRPYLCQVCGSAFGYKAVLKTHMKMHL